MLKIDKYNYFTINSPYVFIKDEHGDEAENKLALETVSKINPFKKAFDATMQLTYGNKRIFEVGDDFDNIIAHYDGPARNTKAGKEAWAQFQEDSKNKIILSKDEYSDLSKAHQGLYLFFRNNKIKSAPLILQHKILTATAAVEFDFTTFVDEASDSVYLIFPTTMSSTTSVNRILDFYDLKLISKILFTLGDYNNKPFEEITFLLAHTDMLVTDITVSRSYAFEKPVDVLAGLESRIKSLESN